MAGATNDTVPSLDEFIAASRSGKSGPCSYVMNTTPEQRALIREKYEAGVHAWAAMCRWLQASGSGIKSTYIIADHFHRGHSDDE